MHVIYSLTCVKIVYCNFCVGVRYFENLYYLENCVTWKTALLWKTVLLEDCVTLKNWLFENCDTWKTALLWKIALLVNCVTLKNCVLWKLWYLKNCDTLKTVILEKILRWGALLVKYCVGVRYFKILLYCKNVVLFENWFSLKTALLDNCDTWKIVLFENFVWKRFLRWGALLVKYCVGVRYIKILLYCKILRCLKTDFLWKLRY